MRTREQEIARYNHLTPAQVGARIGATDEHVRGLIRDGDLPAINIGRKGRAEYRITETDLARWIEERRTGHAA